jgi:DNA-binding MarR family transcriptional regulator
MPDAPNIQQVANDLRVAAGQIVRRVRENRTVPIPQLWALSWIVRQGPKTTSELAALERVRPQSMAHTVEQLEKAELVTRRPDEHDGRKTLIELTPAGATMMEELRLAGESWMAELITQRLTPAEQLELQRGVELLTRLLDD